jgi:membrane dipeptidase
MICEIHFGDFMFLVDAHCDTLHGMLIKKEGFHENSFQINQGVLKESSKEGFLQFFAIFESPSNPLENQKTDVQSMIDNYHRITKKHNLKKVLKKTDLEGGGLKALLSVEGLYFLEGDVSGINRLYKEGVRCISLTWNPDNEFSGGVNGIASKGLTEPGRKLVRKMFKIGIMTDVSHISDKGFWDIAGIAAEYNKPFIASHSNARKLCGHIRNLDDKMLKALARAGGVSGINMFSCFLKDDCSAGENEVIKHIEYICSLTGPDYVGFGCDFDGISREKSAIPGPSALEGILERLLQLNYPEETVKGIASGNFLRVMGQVLK